MAQAPHTLYPYNDQLVSLHHSINEIKGHHFGCFPPSFQKKHGVKNRVSYQNQALKQSSKQRPVGLMKYYGYVEF